MILPPKRPDTLTKMELANIVRSLQAALFLSEDERPPHREFWTDGNVMEGADFVSYVVTLLGTFDLLPREAGPKDWRPR